jgi:hypothetical protein
VTFRIGRRENDTRCPASIKAKAGQKPMLQRRSEADDPLMQGPPDAYIGEANGGKK